MLSTMLTSSRHCSVEVSIFMTDFIVSRAQKKRRKTLSFFVLFMSVYTICLISRATCLTATDIFNGIFKCILASNDETCLHCPWILFVFISLFAMHMIPKKNHINHNDLSPFPFKFVLRRRHESNFNSTVRDIL